MQDRYRLFSQGSLRSILRERVGTWSEELTYWEVLARIRSCFLIFGIQGPVAGALCFGLEIQGGKAEPFWALNFFCWSGVALDFAINKGFSCASRKSWIVNSSGFSGSF